jgi:hypothetical protein
MAVLPSDPANALPENMDLAGALAPDMFGDKVMPRDKPDDLSPSREALVKAWTTTVKQAKEHWKEDFKRMRDDQAFAAGQQWSDAKDDDRYVANITLRHIQQKVASLYAKNPKAVARKRRRILNTVWDGEMASLNAAMDALMMAQQAAQPQIDPMTGAMMPAMPPSPQEMMALEQAKAIVEDAMKVHDAEQQLRRIGDTLEIVYDYNINEQVHPFKVMMKLMVRRAVTTSVGYVKLGFQRLMSQNPEIEARIADISQKLATLERLSADMADGEVKEDSAEAEQLRLILQDLQNTEMAVVREGLIFDFPTSTSIIPDPKCKHLREFLGADWVAQEYMLSVDEVKEIYKVDVGKAYTAYSGKGLGASADTLAATWKPGTAEFGSGDVKQDVACVWEIYNKRDGLVYVVCDGYNEFLREPKAPDIYMERFFPWFAYVINECDNEKTIFPPSDVQLIRHQQKEINRMREGLREHRIANRPLTVAAQGILDEEDTVKLTTRPPNVIVELSALQPGQKIDDVLQAYRGVPIDPNLYEIEGSFTDILRTVGTQEANLGGTSKSTATESNIAQSSQTTALASNIDDLDDLLTQLARAAGQVLLLNVSPQTAQQIAGPGAVWPEMSAQDVAQELFLEIEAASTGRPNQAQEIANAERLVPLLLQIPGIKPNFIAREIMRRMDDRLDLTEAFSSELPSVVAMNSMKGLSSPGGGMVPGAASQGPAGDANAPQPPGMNSQVGRGGSKPASPPGGGPNAPAPNAPLN